MMTHRRAATRFLLAASLLIGATEARALSDCEPDIGSTDQTQIGICDVGNSGSTKDETLFQAAPNPTEPSTGTGVFEPFVRIQDGGEHDEFQNGFNTDEGEPDINLGAKTGIWTRSITFSEVDGGTYLEFALDANEPGSVGSLDNLIDLTEVQLFVGPNLAIPETDGFSVDATTGNLDLVAENYLIWDLDNATNGNVTVTLAASICDTPGQCGSGHGDMTMRIPIGALSLPAGFDPSWNLVFYTAYESAGGATGGFEEWRASDGVIPEPSASLIFAVGLLVARRARR